MVRDRSLGARATDAGLIVLLLLIAFLSLAPLIHEIAISFSNMAAAEGGFVNFWPVGFTLYSYQKIIADPHFFHSFLISVERVLIGGTLNFMLTVLMAYPFSRSAKEFPMRGVYLWFMLFTMLFEGGTIPLYLTVKSLHLFDTIWALVLPGAVPIFNVILVMNFFRNLPKEMSEAGLIDGANPWQMLIRLYIPLSTPALATVTLFSIVGHWNAFFDGLIYMRDVDHYPLQTYIQQLVVPQDISQLSTEEAMRLSEISNQTLNAAKIVVSMLPIMLVYPFLQKYFIHGIMLGSVKE